MKRMISVIAAIMLTIGLTACGNNVEQAAKRKTISKIISTSSILS